MSATPAISASDATIINNIITTNGLSATTADTTASTPPTDWHFATWDTINGELRITALSLQQANLHGNLSLQGLTHLSSLNLMGNNLTSLDITGLPALSTADVRFNLFQSLNDINGFNALPENGLLFFPQQGDIPEEVEQPNETEPDEPANEVEQPTEEVEQPETDEPTEEVEQPETEEPTEEVEQPETDEPTEEVEQPETDEPTEEVEQPETDEPTEEVEQPETEEPTEEVEQPETEEPTEEIEQPETDEPTEEVEQPDTDEPTEEVEQPETEEPTEEVEEPETEEPTEEPEPPEPPQPPPLLQLPAPTALTIANNILTWQAVANARAYDVYADGVFLQTISQSIPNWFFTPTEITELDLTQFDFGTGQVLLQLRAIGDNVNFGDSLLSAAVVLNPAVAPAAVPALVPPLPLETQTPVVTLDGSVISWQGIQNATMFRVYVDGEQRSGIWSIWPIDNPTFNLNTTGLQLGFGDNEIQIRVLGNSFWDSELQQIVQPMSQLSEPVTFVIDPVPTPVVTLNGSIISWQEIENATQFRVYVDGEWDNSTRGIPANRIFNLNSLNPQLAFGSHEIQIRLVNNNIWVWDEDLQQNFRPMSELSEPVTFTMEAAPIPEDGVTADVIFHYASNDRVIDITLYEEQPIIIGPLGLGQLISSVAITVADNTTLTPFAPINITWQVDDWHWANFSVNLFAQNLQALGIDPQNPDELVGIWRNQSTWTTGGPPEDIMILRMRVELHGIVIAESDTFTINVTRIPEPEETDPPDPGPELPAFVDPDVFTVNITLNDPYIEATEGDINANNLGTFSVSLSLDPNRLAGLIPESRVHTRILRIGNQDGSSNLTISGSGGWQSGWQGSWTTGTFNVVGNIGGPRWQVGETTLATLGIDPTDPESLTSNVVTLNLNSPELVTDQLVGNHIITFYMDGEPLGTSNPITVDVVSPPPTTLSGINVTFDMNLSTLSINEGDRVSGLGNTGTFQINLGSTDTGLRPTSPVISRWYRDEDEPSLRSTVNGNIQHAGLNPDDPDSLTSNNMSHNMPMPWNATGWHDGDFRLHVYIDGERVGSSPPIAVDVRDTPRIYVRPPRVPYPGDIEIINNMIANNNLDATPGVIGQPAPANWNFATWEMPTARFMPLLEDYSRLTALNLTNRDLTGSLDLRGLDFLASADLSDNQLTSVIVTGLPLLATLNVSDNRLQSQASVIGLSNPPTTNFTFGSQTVLPPPPTPTPTPQPTPTPTPQPTTPPTDAPPEQSPEIPIQTPRPPSQPSQPTQPQPTPTPIDITEPEQFAPPPEEPEPTEPPPPDPVGMNAINQVTDPASAANAVGNALDYMLAQGELAAEDLALLALFAETAIAQAASMHIYDDTIVVNEPNILELQAISLAAREQIIATMAGMDVEIPRELSANVAFVTTDFADINVVVEPSAMRTDVGQVWIRTPYYDVAFSQNFIQNNAHTPLYVYISSDDGMPLSFAATDIENMDIATRLAQLDGGNRSYTVNFSRPVTEPVRISVPPISGDPTYQTLISATGENIGGRYNPVTSMLESRIRQSGNFTVIENRLDFGDIQTRSLEMQAAIRELASQGIINGMSATEFAPDQPISRAQAAAMVTGILAVSDPNADFGFADVSRADWFFTPVNTARLHGIMTGTSATIFSPHTNIPRDQLVAISARILRSEMSYHNPVNPHAHLAQFSDNATFAEWSIADLSLAARENLIILRADGQFLPNQPITRGEAALILHRLYRRMW